MEVQGHWLFLLQRAHTVSKIALNIENRSKSTIQSIYSTSIEFLIDSDSIKNQIHLIHFL